MTDNVLKHVSCQRYILDKSDRRDMIEMYKILTGKYDVDVAPKVLRVYDSTTRGNMFKLNKSRAKYDLRKFYFTNRVVNAWNQ